MQNSQDKKDLQKLLDKIIEATKEAKGEDIVDIDLQTLNTVIARHFVICHANSGVQVKSIAKEIEGQLNKKLNIKPFHKEGVLNSCWILLDYQDVIVHVFQKECRSFYRLEDLWADGHITKY
ncbi:MAG: ribosome silencing factor [Bacteroidales bacterium]|nr:ribosome silencing factor [Bacteroidales bacterium]